MSQCCQIFLFCVFVYKRPFWFFLRWVDAEPLKVENPHYWPSISNFCVSVQWYAIDMEQMTLGVEEKL